MSDDVVGDAVAVLAAMHRGDVSGAEAVVAGADHFALSGVLAGMLHRLGPVAAGSAQRWEAMLAEWRPGSRLGDVLDD